MSQNLNEEDSNVKEQGEDYSESKKRKSPNKQEQQPLARRKSLRIQEKVPSPKHTQEKEESPKHTQKKKSQQKKKKNTESQTSSLETPVESEVNTSEPTQSSQSTLSQPQSLDPLNAISVNYNAIQSQDIMLDTYKRNQDYIQPLGKLSSKQIQEGKAVLDEIKKLLEHNELDKEKCVDLSNQFYTVVPSQDLSRLPCIDKESVLQEKYTVLKAMQESNEPVLLQ